MRKSWYWIGLLSLGFWGTKPGLAQPLEARVSRYTRFLQDEGWSIASETSNEIQFWEDGQVYHWRLPKTHNSFGWFCPPSIRWTKPPLNVRS
ncbi:MAG: hypothetical protein HC913_13405 [Microscillaceae bacterium]|nr:hypothetical protein [Microscillaceae bacterium]